MNSKSNALKTFLFSKLVLLIIELDKMKYKYLETRCKKTYNEQKSEQNHTMFILFWNNVFGKMYNTEQGKNATR